MSPARGDERGPQKKVSLIGHSPSAAAEDKGRLNVTLHHNWYENIATGSNLSRSNWGASLDQVFALDATNVVNLRLNFTRMFEDHSSPSAGFNPADLGFPLYLAANSQYLHLPVVTFAQATSGYRNIGQTGANTLPSQSLQFFGNWSGIRAGRFWRGSIECGAARCW